LKSNAVVLVVVILCVICFVLAACGLCLIYGFVSSQGGGYDLGSPPQTGVLAPGFQLESIDGDQVSLMDFRGKPVLVIFWAIWCGPCLQEMPVIQDRFQEHYPNLVVLAVEEGQSVDELRDFVDHADLTFWVLSGSDAIARRYVIRAFPTSVFIDANGVIRSIVVGSMSGADLDEELAKIGVEN
jgi:peroxiredoxin